ncbi:MerR family transcriptional regulator [Prauserella cavernicola]|uniref:MerR family transcriptional regulator n=1 Tax=Prauserella cavernicola TaxID=2800127 RepID=A0A934V7A2_9PSEU|nr:MerR family transcriptional regulator [Prauserella cavernicola]MBK1787030.1 MerR family transcriptional regulator [Prauserella cavernicola]
MTGRLSIGEFAHASGLTPKALRLYDELGLLRPADVDPRSGYRTYEPDQLARARLVAWLRGLGMPLARIRIVCDLPPRSAAAEVASYWRQVEADTAARKELAAFLVDHLSGKDVDMTDMPVRLTLRSAARTDRGLVRQTNEDAAYPGGRLFAIADGFGAQGADSAAGSSAGAAGAAVAALAPRDTDVAAGSLLAALATAVTDAADAVRDFAADRPHAGTTLTALLFSGAQFALAHVGDSRAYLLRGGELTQLTHDHTYVQSLVDEGRLTAEEAAVHPRRTTLIRALHQSEPDLHLRTAQPGDRYLLCTDGVHAVLAEERVTAVLRDTTAPGAAVEELTRLVHDAGAPDNLACVVVDAA